MPDHAAHLVASSILAERSLQIEEILSSFLSPGVASSLKALAFILCFSKLRASESRQSFEGPRSRQGVVFSCRPSAPPHNRYLCLHGTKQPVHAIVRSLAAMVATERHLWLKHLRIKEKNYFNILKNIFSLKPLSCVFFFFLAFCYHHRDSGQDV